MPTDPRQSTIILGLRNGDPAAAERLWAEYFERVAIVARREIGNVPRRAFDEEDVALSVLDRLCRGVEQGNFKELNSRGDLWALLLTMTAQKATDRVRYELREKRGGGRVRGNSAFVRASDGSVVLGIEQFVSEAPTPQMLVELQECSQRLLASLPDTAMRNVARMRLEGHTVQEIADRLGYTTRWAERKLQRIREKWLRELQAESQT